MDRQPVEVTIPKPARDGEWPLMTQAAIVPWKMTAEGVAKGKVEHAMLVPRAAWEKLLVAADRAEAFIAGFEGDELQVGIDEHLATLRASLRAFSPDGDAVVARHEDFARESAAKGT